MTANVFDFYEVVNKRRTVRDFEDYPISDEVLTRIIDAGFKAPTNDYMRDWHFIVIKDKSVIFRLLEIIPKDISESDINQLIIDWNLNDTLQQKCYKEAVPKQYQMLATASALIIPLFKQKVDILHPENLSHLNGLASIWCCIENIFLAATYEGYACNLRIPLGNEGEHSKAVLGYPDDYLIPCIIGIGKPKQDLKPVEQKKFDLKERIHINKW